MCLHVRVVRKNVSFWQHNVHKSTPPGQRPVDHVQLNSIQDDSHQWLMPRTLPGPAAGVAMPTTTPLTTVAGSGVGTPSAAGPTAAATPTPQGTLPPTLWNEQAVNDVNI